MRAKPSDRRSTPTSPHRMRGRTALLERLHALTEEARSEGRFTWLSPELTAEQSRTVLDIFDCNPASPGDAQGGPRARLVTRLENVASGRAANRAGIPRASTLCSARRRSSWPRSRALPARPA